MQIFCGTDIIEIERIKREIDQHGKKFINRIYTEDEINYCESKRLAKYQHYAARFAGKEAIFKAVSKRLDNAYVCPFLLGVKNSDVKGPLSQFQSTTFDKDDVKKLVVSINNALSGDSLKPELLEKTFEIWWPTLEKKLQEIDAKPEAVQDAQFAQKANKKDELMEELLKVSRSNQRLLSNPSSLFPVDYFEAIIRKAINSDRIPASAYQTIQNVYYTINELRREWDSIYPSINQSFSSFDRSMGGNLLQAANNIGWRIAQVQQTMWNLLQANN